MDDLRKIEATESELTKMVSLNDAPERESIVFIKYQNYHWLGRKKI